MTGNFRKRSQNASLTASSAVLAALALAGCGGGERASQPRIEAAVADRLAEQSDEIARLLDAHLVCEAAHAADRLESEAQEAVDAGAVPPALAEELGARTTELVDEVNCPQPPPPDEEAEEEKGKGKKGKGKGKGQGKDGEGDEE